MGAVQTLASVALERCVVDDGVYDKDKTRDAIMNRVLGRDEQTSSHVINLYFVI